MLPCLLAGSNQPDVQPGSCRGSTQPELLGLGTFKCKWLILKAARALNGEEGEMPG